MNKRIIIEAKWSTRTRGQRRKYGNRCVKSIGAHITFYARPTADSEWNSTNMRGITRLWHHVHYMVEYTPLGHVKGSSWDRAYNRLQNRIPRFEFQNDFTEEHLKD